MLDPEIRGRIQEIFEKFLSRRLTSIRKLKIADNVNPFLLRLLANELRINNAQSIVKWLVSQRLERSTVTSFGSTLQKVAKVFSEGTGVEGGESPKGRLISSCSPGTRWRHIPMILMFKALLRIAVVWNIPFACNHASADFMIASPLMSKEYQRQLPDFDSYRQRLKT